MDKMAAPMNLNAAKARLTLLRFHSKCFDSFKLGYKRSNNSYNRHKGKSKTIKGSRLDFDEPGKILKDSLSGQSGKIRFKDILTQRCHEASQSVLVRTRHPGVTMQKLQSIGPLEYAGFTSVEKRYILAQFREMRDLDSLIREESSLFPTSNQFPMQSRVVMELTKPSANWRNPENMSIVPIEEYPKSRLNIMCEPKKSFDEEVRALDSLMSLNEFDLRQRFFVCSLFEDMLKSILPEALVTPYGSCLNGFGWWNGDLDMMLSLDRRTHPYAAKTSRQDLKSMSFRFLTGKFSTERQLAQRTLSAVGGLVDLMPLVVQVIRILNARVPIISFSLRDLGLQCDLSLQAMDSIKMTETLYLLSANDPRVRPLMTTIKQWALHHQLTSSGKQQKLTTLGFLCLLIFYLQTCQPAVLPSFKRLKSFSSSDKRDTFEIDRVRYRLPSYPSSIPASTNTQSMENLLHGFFDFFASFNFETHGISIIEGSPFLKPDNTSPLFVENPYRIGLNICQNVNQGCVQNLQLAMKSAAQAMDGFARNDTGDVEESRLKVLFGYQVKDDGVHLIIDSLFSDNQDNSNDGGITIEEGKGEEEKLAFVDSQKEIIP